MKTKNGSETEYTYNELDQLVSDSDATYEYDLNGNLVRVVGGAQAALYEYNSENKLVKATVQQGINVVEETYTYDYAGNRTSKTTSTSDGNSEFVKYLNDNSSLTNVLAELDSEGNVQVYYTIGADLISQERGGRTYTYLYDGHGSVVGLADESGKVTDIYTYDAFGNLLKSTGRTANNYRYCGEQFDSTTGLYYLRARYMDTSTGRFISQDSYAGSVYDPVSLHKYLYANSNPVNNVDPSGYFSLGELSVCSAISSALDTISNNFAMAVWASFIGGFIAVGDQLSTGNLNPKDLIAEFGKGFIAGFAFSLLSMFLPVKLMMAVSGLGIIGGFAGAVKSFSDGEFWQGVYRTSLSTLGGIAWWRNYGNTIKEWSKGLFESGKSDTRIKIEQALKELDKSGVKPGQTEISESKIQQILENYDSSKAQSSIYTDSNNTKYIVDGHHTTVASKINGKGTSANMGQPTNQEPSATDVYWWKEWYEFWKTVIEIKE